MNFLATNEGTVDRLLRIVIGLGVLSLIVVGPKTLWGLVGLVPLATGIVGSCPLYSMIGVNTCSLKKRKTATQN
jgi:hypothetical protein